MTDKHMTDESRHQHWEDVHADVDDSRLSWYQQIPALSLEFIENTGIGRDARIIDIGGGTSRLVDVLLHRGYEDITVLDIADNALELARQRLGEAASKVEWIHADITRWAPGAAYDVWHDRAVFHFLTEAVDREAYKQHLRQALKPGGHVIIATFAPDGPVRCSGLPVRRYSPEALAAELGSEFALVESEREDHHTPGDAVQRFQFSRFMYGVP